MKWRKRRATNSASRHVRLHHWLLNSPAYKSLGVCARALLIEYYRRYNGSNNGDIGLSVRDAASALGVAVGTVRKAIVELEERGFIRANQRGAFRWKARHATTWILTEFEYAGQPPTKAFMRWGQVDKPLTSYAATPPRTAAPKFSAGATNAEHGIKQ